MLEDLYTHSARTISIKNQPYKRKALDEISIATKCCLIQGDRGIGKTTLAVQFLLKQVKGDHLSRDILYISADHYLMTNLSLYEVAEQFNAQGGKWLAIDEIHKYPNWSGELKSILDTFVDLMILVTGSSALKVSQGSHDLSRRAILYKLPGLSLREYLEISLQDEFPSFELQEITQNHQRIADNIIQQLARHDTKILKCFQDYCHAGYYAYYFSLNEIKSFRLTLEQSVTATIESDLMAIYPALTGHSIRKIKALLAYIANSVPFTPNWRNLKEIVGVSDERTVKNYFSYLEDSAIIRTIYKTGKKISNLNTGAKVFLSNPNLAYAIAHADSNIGMIRECYFVGMLSPNYELTVPYAGDFCINNDLVVEIGGAKKTNQQIRDVSNGILALDGIEMGSTNKIPLWLFGFIY